MERFLEQDVWHHHSAVFAVKWERCRISYVFNDGSSFFFRSDSFLRFSFDLLSCVRLSLLYPHPASFSPPRTHFQFNPQ